MCVGRADRGRSAGGAAAMKVEMGATAKEVVLYHNMPVGRGTVYVIELVSLHSGFDRLPEQSTGLLIPLSPGTDAPRAGRPSGGSHDIRAVSGRASPSNGG